MDQQTNLVVVAVVGILIFVAGFFVSKINFFKHKNKGGAEAVDPVELSRQYAREKAFFEGILQNVQEGILVSSPAGLVIWGNRKALEILKTSWIMAGNKPIEQVLSISKQEQNQQSLELKLTTFDSEIIYVKVKVYPLNLTNDPASVYKMYILYNATEEATLKEMKLDFVAITAHQLRTPLTSMKGYLYLLSKAISTKLNNKERVFLERLTTSTDRLSSLIENLLNVSQIEKGSLKLVLKSIDLENIVKQTVEELLESARENNVQLVIDKLTPPYPPILGDASLLSEALLNIISNGIKYNHPGGQVSVLLEKQTEGVTIHISDTGKGIPTELQTHLFQKFYQATSSLSELSNGLGLGLYISKSIIDAHKGAISVNSIEERGTDVSIFLPSMQPQADPLPQAL